MRKPTSRPRAAIATSIALAGALLVSVAGCAAAPTASPAGSSAPSAAAPLFASDAEALAAATAAYSKYLEVSDQIARDGGANPERLKPYVSASLLEQQVKEYQAIAGKALHAAGSSSFNSLKLQSRTVSGVSAYVCLDVSGLRVLNAANSDVTPSSRQSKIPLSISVASATSGFLVDSSDVWTGTNFCA
jgi:hypothetical protein